MIEKLCFQLSHIQFLICLICLPLCYEKILLLDSVIVFNVIVFGIVILLTIIKPQWTIATCQHNISPHCWAFGHHVAMCCDMLGCCWLKFDNKLQSLIPNCKQTVHLALSVLQNGLFHLIISVSPYWSAFTFTPQKRKIKVPTHFPSEFIKRSKILTVTPTDGL